MPSLQKIASSLLWLAAISSSSAELITVTRTTDGPLPTTIRQPAPTNIKLRAETPLASTPTSTAPLEYLTKPTMWNLDSGNPNSGEAPVDFLQVELQQNGSVSKEQAAVFRGLPAAAKGCTLGWRQAGKGERNFQVGAHGMTKVRQLGGFPADGQAVTFDGLLAFDAPNATVWSPDFSFWPDLEQWDHPSGQIACAGEIYLRIVINRDGGDGFVHLDQDEKNGFYISYTL